jgi:hypothetical protein
MSAAAHPSPAAPRAIRPTSTGARIAGVIALVLHLGIAVFPFSASGLLAPLWAIAVVYAGWVVAAALGVRIWRRHPAISLLVPPTTVALWAGFMTVGDALLGWTA